MRLIGRHGREELDGSDCLATALGAVRAVTDPTGIMNPGVLLG